MLWNIITGLLLFGVTGTALILLISHAEGKQFEITHYTIKAPCFCVNPNPVSVVVLADLHNHVYGKENETLLRAIREAKPEAVLVAGDLPVAVPGHTVEIAERFICKVAEEFPVYYALGNHEYRMKLYPEQYGCQYEPYLEHLREAGVVVLDNASRTVKLGNAVVRVCGLSIGRDYYKRFRTHKMSASYVTSHLPVLDKSGPENENLYTILLAHNPLYFEAYADAGADLVIAGHVHGGLVRIGSQGLISPSVGLFPKYSGGLYEDSKGRQMVLSRGLGGHTLPIRVHNRPELAVVHFQG